MRIPTQGIMRKPDTRRERKGTPAPLPRGRAKRVLSLPLPVAAQPVPQSPLSRLWTSPIIEGRISLCQVQARKRSQKGENTNVAEPAISHISIVFAARKGFPAAARALVFSIVLVQNRVGKDVFASFRSWCSKASGAAWNGF